MIQLTFAGPEGPYTLMFELEEDTPIDVQYGSHRLRWSVEHIDEDGKVSGLTWGTKPMWGDVYWFELVMRQETTQIEYWGNQVLIRVDGEFFG